MGLASCTNIRRKSAPLCHPEIRTGCCKFKLHMTVFLPSICQHKAILYIFYVTSFFSL